VQLAIELFPESTEVTDGELRVGGVGARELADQFGTPLLVLCERTLRERARAFQGAVRGAPLYYGTKAFPNVGVMRVLAEEGLGADVSTLGELAFARAAGLEGERLVVHGNNKSEAELRAAADAGATVALDALGEAERAAAAGVRRVLVRVTPGVEADTHEAIRTGHHGSKFGLPPEDVPAALVEARETGLEAIGLHVHVGSQLPDAGAHLAAAPLVADLAVRLRDDLGWTPAVVDCGGGFGVRHTLEDPEPNVPALLAAVAAAVLGEWHARGLPEPRLAFEPGRSLVGPAGVTLYRVGVVKRTGAGPPWVAVDGGMSDNPRPQLYGARYTALLATRPNHPATGAFAIAGKHCESGDVLIDRVELPEPLPGDLLAVPVTGAYTLGMASNYNGVPRPAAVLVADGKARLVRRRETVEDLLALETS
jgi:diaminopimelate decarboxylase